jgi:hypothetical protein
MPPSKLKRLSLTDTPEIIIRLAEYTYRVVQKGKLQPSL